MMELRASSEAKLARLKRPAKTHMFFSGLQTQNKYSNNIGRGLHTKGGTCMERIGKRKET
jgi:hypothetical protein